MNADDQWHQGSPSLEVGQGSNPVRGGLFIADSVEKPHPSSSFWLWATFTRRANQTEIRTAQELPLDGFASLQVQSGRQRQGEVHIEARGLLLGANDLHLDFIFCLHACRYPIGYLHVKDQIALMSLHPFEAQGALFSLSALSGQLFAQNDRYRLFAQKVYPVLVKARSKLASAYCLDHGRPGIEPVLLAGVSLLQYIERVPDRQAVEMLQYHAGWNFALGRQLGDPPFHFSVLSCFRDRLLEHEQSATVFAQML